ncbi:MAG: sodium:solute symporter [Verrucomicrobiota bacterium]|nr:sodium:solute symporter [Verrucomicrobiota bacterium]
MHPSFAPLDWIVLIAYFVATIGIGCFFYRKTRTTDGFTAGNRSIPGWVCGLSIFATFLSSISYLANAGKTFVSDWNAFVFSLTVPIGTWVAVRWFLPYYRKSQHVSAYAALEDRFGLWARLYASFFYMLTQLARMAVVMYLVALPMQVIFGWNIMAILLFVGISVTLYSFVGGVLAVIWTDAIQAIVLIAGAVIALGVMLVKMPGGAGQIFEVASAHDKFSLGSFSLEMAEKTFWTLILFGIAENLRNFGIDQSYIQRYIASKSDEEAKRGLWIAGWLYVPMSAVFFFIGTALFAFYSADKVIEIETTSPLWESIALEDLNQVRQVVARQELLQQGADSNSVGFAASQAQLASKKGIEELGDRVFPYFIATQLPPGITGLLIAAVFAAGMSTISTSLNSSATLFMTDYYRRLINPGASERKQMGALYLATFLWGAAGTCLALLLVQVTQSALDMWWTLSGIFSGGMVGLFLLGLISQRARNPQAVTAVMLGLVVILWMSLPKVAEMFLRADKASMVHSMGSTMQNLSSGGLASPFNALLIPVIGTLTILLSGILFSKWFGRDGDSPTSNPWT